MIKKVLEKIESESLNDLKNWFQIWKEEIIQKIKQKLIHVIWNEFLYYENSSIRVKTTCIVSKYWYWEDYWSNKTPTGLHIVNEYIWDGYPSNQRFIAKNPIETVDIPSFWEHKPWMYWRLLTLDWIENKNSNTYDRKVYIHGNIHNWYWKTEDLNRSKWCIWLKLDEMVMIFNMLKYYKDKVFVYIEEKK